MLQQLIKYFIFIIINALFSFSNFFSYGANESVFTNLNTVDNITDKIANIPGEIENFNQNPKFPNFLNSDQQNKNIEFKSCSAAQIIVLNKITANSKELLLDINESQYFGNIQIKLHKCVKNLDPYDGDTYMLLTITEYKIDADSTLIFQGWVTSSSVSLSTFEHPIYELFAKDCL